LAHQKRSSSDIKGYVSRGTSSPLGSYEQKNSQNAKPAAGSANLMSPQLKEA